MPHLPQQIERRNGAGTNSSNGVNGNHYPPAPLMLPMPAPPPSESEGGLDMPGIWNAFRRRWFLALGLGFLFGIPAAIGVWTIAPAPYVSFVELRVNSINQQTFPGNRDNRVPNFNVWRQTVIKRATDPETTLMEALRDPSVQNASMLREHQPDVHYWLEENLVVKTTGHEYFRIELEGENPQEVADILSAVGGAIEVLIHNNLIDQWRIQEKNVNSLLTQVDASIKGGTDALKKMHGDLKVDPNEIRQHQASLYQFRMQLQSHLRDIELERLRFRAQGNLVANQPDGPNIDALVNQKSVLDAEYQKVTTELDLQNDRIAKTESYMRAQSETLGETHPSLVAAREDLGRMKTELEILIKKQEEIRGRIKDELLAKFREGSGKGMDADAQIDQYKKVFEDALSENEQNFISELDEIKAKQEKLDQYSHEAQMIKERIEEDKEERKRLEAERKRLRFEIDNSPQLVQISRKPVVPHARSLKKKTMLSGVAGFGIFGFFVAGIVFLEYRTRRIATLNQVSETLNLRVMGTVPLLPRSAANGSTVKKKAKNALWYSALTEAIDSTRTLLIRGSQMESLKTVMVASAMTGEGKTTLASHLATSLARGGRKILLVDCDLRRPCMHRAFDLPAGQGVCEVLRGEADLPDCIQELNSPPGLSVLPAGKLNQQVLKLLAMDSLGEMLEPLKQEYDFIIIDSSPLLPVTDGLLVAQHVDGVILSIRRDISRVGKVVMACQKLSMLGIPLLGAVTIGLQEESHYAKTAYKHYAYGNGQHYYNQPPL